MTEISPDGNCVRENIIGLIEVLGRVNDSYIFESVLRGDLDISGAVEDFYCELKKQNIGFGNILNKPLREVIPLLKANLKEGYGKSIRDTREVIAEKTVKLVEEPIEGLDNINKVFSEGYNPLEHVKETLKEKRSNQTALASVIGVPPGNLSAMLSGKRPIPLKVAVKIENETGVNAFYLVTYREYKMIEENKGN